ncbi:MAG: GTPase ObgE [Rickettsiales bacterium]|jgi:GTP-binding protein|nr:GTPase ObgE [Rickettsiales bacterium]
MKFQDYAKIFVKAGNGGKGSAHMRHEKFIEYGGPDGGDGGRGGDVIIRSVANANTLVDYRYQKNFTADNGRPGGQKQQTGASGDDLILSVPVGTVVLSGNSQIEYADLDTAGAEYRAAKGGNGGWGNLHFKSPTNRAPRQANSGLPGEEREIVLQLKLIADIGLVGFPNAGKSTLLAAITGARPKIADYPFTTLAPQLGVMYSHGREFVLVDLPGLIEGAAEGVGLGHKFLAHAERTRLVLHLIDGTEPDWAARYKAIRFEMDSYGFNLIDKPEIIVVNKIDAVDAADWKDRMAKLKRAAKGREILAISAAGLLGLDELKKAIEMEDVRRKMEDGSESGI